MKQLTVKQLQGLLCSAFEGGSNYWYQIEAHALPAGVEEDDFREGGRFTDPGDYWHPEEIVPVTPGCASLILDRFDDHKIGVWLNRRALRRGLDLMFEKYPHHAADILAENDDANTGDVLLQLAVYGEVVYG